MKKNNIKLELFCITNKRLKFLENTSYNLCWVGQQKAPDGYLKCDNGVNIFSKEKYYSELTFQYWYWKNKLDLNNPNWIGFCQKRRFWAKTNDKTQDQNKKIDEKILYNPKKEWMSRDAIICDPISVNKIKKIKMIKRGFRSLIKNPMPFFFEKKQSIKFNFDMHHGYGNIDKAIDVLNIDDRNDFREFLNNNYSYNPHIMFISKSHIMNKWFENLFDWLFECEKIFGFEVLKGYDTTRLYAYLAERYLSFWFRKYTRNLNWQWIFYDCQDI